MNSSIPSYPFIRMNARSLSRWLLCVLLVCACGVASATQATLTGDTFVNSSRPSTNFGNLSNLYVGNGNTGLLQFDLSNLPAGTTASQVAKATLYLYVNRIFTQGMVSLQPATSAWTELGTTYSSAPSYGGVSGTFSAATSGAYIAVDVTSLVQTWITTPSTNYGLALTASSASVLFDSKENDQTSHQPLLDITLSVQGPQGVPGGAGATGAAGPIGPVGPQGVPGVSGPVGPQGAVGPAGLTGPQGPPTSFMGTWLVGTTYSLGDAVFYNGSSYVSLIGGNAGHEPDTSTAQWSLLAEQGATGAVGAVGAIGPQGIQGVPGITGAQGPIGPIGPQGAIGPTGLTGSVGPAGPTGSTGATGATGAIGPQGPPVSFQGPWNIATTYAMGDAVYCAACSTNGSSYISLVAGNVGFDPPTSNVKWALLAEQGAAGVAGAIGPAGPSGPAGAAGAAGPQGPAGQNGSGVNTITFDNDVENPGQDAGTTFYVSPVPGTPGISPSNNASIASNFTAMPVACTMSALNVGVDNFQAAGVDTTTITVYHNGSATLMSCSVTTDGDGSSCHDTTHTFSVSAGDSISLGFVETNASPYNKVNMELVCQ